MITRTWYHLGGRAMTTRKLWLTEDRLEEVVSANSGYPRLRTRRRRGSVQVEISARYIELPPPGRHLQDVQYRGGAQAGRKGKYEMRDANRARILRLSHRDQGPNCSMRLHKTCAECLSSIVSGSVQRYRKLDRSDLHPTRGSLT